MVESIPIELCAPARTIHSLVRKNSPLLDEPGCFTPHFHTNFLPMLQYAAVASRIYR